MINYKGYTGVFEYDETIDALAGHMVDIAGRNLFRGPLGGGGEGVRAPGGGPLPPDMSSTAA